jgi:hypothetical protein
MSFWEGKRPVRLGRCQRYQGIRKGEEAVIKAVFMTCRLGVEAPCRTCSRKYLGSPAIKPALSSKFKLRANVVVLLASCGCPSIFW